MTGSFLKTPRDLCLIYLYLDICGVGMAQQQRLRFSPNRPGFKYWIRNIAARNFLQDWVRVCERGRVITLTPSVKKYHTINCY